MNSENNNNKNNAPTELQISPTLSAISQTPWLETHTASQLFKKLSDPQNIRHRFVNKMECHLITQMNLGTVDQQSNQNNKNEDPPIDIDVNSGNNDVNKTENIEVTDQFIDRIEQSIIVGKSTDLFKELDYLQHTNPELWFDTILENYKANSDNSDESDVYINNDADSLKFWIEQKISMDLSFKACMYGMVNQRHVLIVCKIQKIGTLMMNQQWKLALQECDKALNLNIINQSQKNYAKEYQLLMILNTFTYYHQFGFENSIQKWIHCQKYLASQVIYWKTEIAYLGVLFDKLDTV